MCITLKLPSLSRGDALLLSDVCLFCAALVFLLPMLTADGTTKQKAACRFFPMGKFSIVRQSTFESLNEILRYEHSNETSSADLSHGTIYVVCSSNF